MNIFVISKELKSVKQFVVFNNIRIGCIPDIITVSNHFTEFLNDFPIIVSFKFKAVSPHIHHVQILGLEQRRKPFSVLQQLMGMVAGGFPGHEIIGNRKVVGVADDAGVPDAQRGQHRRDLGRPAAVGVGQPPHRVSHDGFQPLAVLQNLAGHLIQRAAGDRGMQAGVAGDLVTAVQVPPLAGRNAVIQQQPGIEVEGAPHAVAVEQLHQAAVLHPAVIKAHCQDLVASAGETDVDILQFGPFHDCHSPFAAAPAVLARYTQGLPSRSEVNTTPLPSGVKQGCGWASCGVPWMVVQLVPW